MTETTEPGLEGVWLALDTSTAAMTAALFTDGRVIAEQNERADRIHSIRLVPAIRELTAAAGLRTAELAGVAVGNGPGSYTGIRIATTVAKTLAWSMNIPLIGISSLEALAYGAAPAGGDDAGDVWVVPLMDARRGKVYTGLYRQAGGQWRCEAEDGVRMLTDWLEELGKHIPAQSGTRRSTVMLTGDMAGLEGHLERLGLPHADCKAENRALRAADIAQLAMLYGMRRQVTDVHRYIPNYTQLSEPEKKWANNNK